MTVRSNLDLLLIADGDCDAAASVRDVYRDTYLQDGGGELDSSALTSLVVCRWSGASSAERSHTAWRLVIELDILEEEGEADGEAEGLEFAGKLIDAILDLPKQADSGIAAVIKLGDPVQFHGHAALYAQVYELEMLLREVVSFIFAAEFPEALIDGLARSMVKPASVENLPQDSQLIKFGENRFFYILFNNYAVLNTPPELRIAQIHQALTAATSFDEVRSALDLRPIKNERHAGFLASLHDLMRPLERVRNAVAHNRTVPEKYREDFQVAAGQLSEEVAAFWAREAEQE